MKNVPPEVRPQFASDNCSGICPEALDSMIRANQGYSESYGEDIWTRNASDAIREFFQCDCDVFFVFNGTAANSLALSSICRPYHSIICHEMAHIETDECGSPEFFSNGAKLLTVPGANGKIDFGAVEARIVKRKDIHYPRPHVLSITQSTEAGTVYSPEELQSINKLARKYGLFIHMDGARFANAVASLKVHPSEISWKSGVDVLCLGGTKNGLAYSEAVVFFNRSLATDFEYHCKQAGQLASKMRFMTAPWVDLIESRTWLKNAENANHYARLLSERLSGFKEIRVMYPPEANAVFVSMESNLEKELRDRGWIFHNFFAAGCNRFMCSWSTREEDIEMLCEDIRQITKS